jgi:hypothetical protein
MSPTRRRIRLAVFAATTSVVSVVAVAWSSALLLDYGDTSTSRQAQGLSSSEWWSVHHKRTFAGVRFVSVVMIRADQYQDSNNLVRVPDWARLPVPQAMGSWRTNQHYELVDGRGWPWPCLSYRFSGTGRGAATTGMVSGGLALTPFSTGAWYSPRALPYTPLWGGLIADLAVHFGIWVGLLLLIVEGRRWWRRRHRRCPNCGYSLRGAAHTACPECGEPVATEQFDNGLSPTIGVSKSETRQIHETH